MDSFNDEPIKLVADRFADEAQAAGREWKTVSVTEHAQLQVRMGPGGRPGTEVQFASEEGTWGWHVRHDGSVHGRAVALAKPSDPAPPALLLDWTPSDADDCVVLQIVGGRSHQFPIGRKST